MQRRLADADRRVGPDAGEADVGGHRVGRDRSDVREPVGLGVGRAQVERPLVHVDRPHRRVGARRASVSAIGP